MPCFARLAGGAGFLQARAEHAVAGVEQQAEAHRHAFADELRDRLRLAIFEQFEIVAGQSGDQLTVRVDHGGVDARQIDARAKEPLVTEADVLRAARASKTSRAIRQGAQLRLQTPGAAPLILEDSAESRYRALGPVGHADTWLVARLPASQRAPLLLVSPASSQQLGLEAAPRPAPDGHLLIAVRPGEDGRDSATLTLLQRAGQRWSVVFRYEAPSGLHLSFQRWRSDGAAVHLLWQRTPTPACPLAEGSAQLRDGPFGWDFVPEMPPPCQAAPAHSSSGAS